MEHGKHVFAMPTFPGDKEIRLKLKARTDEELLRFRTRLKTPRYKDNPQAIAIRYYILRELLSRTLTDEGRIR
jgi:hypothetical protein